MNEAWVSSPLIDSEAPLPAGASSSQVKSSGSPSASVNAAVAVMLVPARTWALPPIVSVPTGG